MNREKELQRFWHEVGMGITEHPDERLGQNLFNTLHFFRPDLGEKLRCTTIDPFYRDENYDKAVEWISENW